MVEVFFCRVLQIFPEITVLSLPVDARQGYDLDLAELAHDFFAVRSCMSLWMQRRDELLPLENLRTVIITVP